MFVAKKLEKSKQNDGPIPGSVEHDFMHGKEDKFLTVPKGFVSSNKH